MRGSNVASRKMKHRVEKGSHPAGVRGTEGRCARQSRDVLGPAGWPAAGWDSHGRLVLLPLGCSQGPGREYPLTRAPRGRDRQRMSVRGTSTAGR